ncbi:MAG: Uma2 family endonuclease [Actinomycetota bacterium]|nr:Uma2 family endonuclease [Actinomycetota bacterium]
MRALLLDVPEELLQERHRKGLDGHDEMWDGVLHMVPAASSPHQLLAGELMAVMLPLAKLRGLLGMPEAGLYRPGPGGEQDYRIPDLVFARPEDVMDRGVEGQAELVIEILSPGDESYAKLGFYGEMGVRELLIVDPRTRQLELFRLEDGRLVAVPPDSVGTVTSSSLGLTLSTVDGPKLRLAWDNGSADI